MRNVYYLAILYLCLSVHLNIYYIIQISSAGRMCKKNGLCNNLAIVASQLQDKLKRQCDITKWLVHSSVFIAFSMMNTNIVHRQSRIDKLPSGYLPLKSRMHYLLPNKQSSKMRTCQLRDCCCIFRAGDRGTCLNMSFF